MVVAREDCTHQSMLTNAYTHLSEAFVFSKCDFTSRTGTWVWWPALEMLRRENQSSKPTWAMLTDPIKRTRKMI